MKKEAANSLMFCTGWIYRLLRRHVQDNGVRFTQLMVLMDLKVLGKSSPKDLAEIEQLRRPTMSLIIRELKDQNLVTCKQDPADGRGIIVEITDSGQRLLLEQGESMAEVLINLLDDLPDTIILDLQSSLSKLQQRLVVGLNK